MSKTSAGGFIAPVPAPALLPGDDMLQRPDAAVWFRSLIVEPVSALEWDLDPHFKQGPRTTVDVMWVWLRRGKGVMRVGPPWRDISVRSGDHLFFPPGTEHIENLPGPNRSKMVSIHFSANAYGGVDILRGLGFPIHIRERTGRFLAEAAERLVREFAYKQTGWREAMAGEITSALIRIARFYGRAFQSPDSAAEAVVLERLRPALVLLAARISDSDLTIGELATSVHLSEVRFRALFRRTLNLSPVRYLQRLRLEQVCVRLLSTSDPIPRIAAESGFGDLSHFYRTFRRWTSQTPAEFRARGEEFVSKSLAYP